MVGKGFSSVAVGTSGEKSWRGKSFSLGSKGNEGSSSGNFRKDCSGCNSSFKTCKKSDDKSR